MRHDFGLVLAWLAFVAAAFAACPVHAGVAVDLAEPALEERIAALDELKQQLSGLPAVSGSLVSETGKKRAFVVGNDNYAEVPKLNKAVGDATSISAALRLLGFDVTTRTNLARDDFDDALDAFYESLHEGDVAFVYYSGHGIAVDGTNYLLPVDAPAIDPDDARRVRREAVDANELVESLAGRGVQLALVVLDACRDDPFARAGTRGAASLRGLVPIIPNKGVFVIYSAGVGEKALDRLSDADMDPNSIFTRKFMPILETPGLPLVDIAKRTQVEVRELAQQARHKQAPAYYDQVVGQYYFQPPKPKLYGITIGVDQYVGESLQGAVNDAERIARSLEALGAEKVVRLFDRDARLQFIEYVWRDMIEDARPGDTIVLSYAGSSTQVIDRRSPEADGRDEVLMLSEVDMVATKNGDIGAAPDGSLIFDDKLTEWLTLAADKNVNVVLLVDGCHGGGLLDREFANVSFVGASAEDEMVMEAVVEGRKHGLASVGFAQGIEGVADYNRDSFVTQRELFHCISEFVLRGAVRTQTPQFMPALVEMPPPDGSIGKALPGAKATDLPLFRVPSDIVARIAAGSVAPYPSDLAATR